ncbi:hypothetical protein LG200_06125 [Methylobacillus caricis]|uniref:hypothetical protein n=1 Tax=Methylobacillus caricis TaxID=1971611 RepID=UPI001CFF9C6A|nr:hypothetical protein [Methylobacillus caricis]MCB5187583.1 hypothetical protein [Methylobacillus caricis]
MKCLIDLGSGQYQVLEPQPSDYTTCMQLVVSPSELQNGVMHLTAAEGVQISLAIGLLWAIAAAFRVVIHMLKERNGDSNEAI